MINKFKSKSVLLNSNTHTSIIVSFSSTRNLIVQFVIQPKHGEFSLAGLERHTEESFPFI